jgi:hypothetical protein
VGLAAAASSTSNTYGVFIIDILDYANTNKYKTVRTLGGYDANGSGVVSLRSNSWRNTSAITSVKFYTGGTTSDSRFALYGIKGALTMAAGNTYEAIATTTLGSASATVTFSSISSSYTDLRVVANVVPVNNGAAYLGVRVGNGSLDTGSNYSFTQLYGTGSAAGSVRETNVTLWEFEGSQFQSSSPFTFLVDVQNYSNTTTNKTVLARSSRADTIVRQSVGLWRSTSAINTLSLYVTTSNASFGIGSTFSLYGIAAA